MTFVVGLALVSLGFVLGIFVTAHMCWDETKERVTKSGYIIIDSVLYKCIKVEGDKQ